jgi:hypothetical protein
LLVTGINVVLLGSDNTPIEGPGLFDRDVLLRFGAPTLRINARGSLTIAALGVHFAPSQRTRLPGILRFTVNVRDDNGHSVSSSEIAIVITPSVELWGQILNLGVWGQVLNSRPDFTGLPSTTRVHHARATAGERPRIVRTRTRRSASMAFPASTPASR